MVAIWRTVNGILCEEWSSLPLTLFTYFLFCLPYWQVIRVYIGSFWSHPLLIPDNRKLFEAEEQDLFKDIQSLPRNAALRKLNDLIKRARLAKVRSTCDTGCSKQLTSNNADVTQHFLHLVLSCYTMLTCLSCQYHRFICVLPIYCAQLCCSAVNLDRKRCFAELIELDKWQWIVSHFLNGQEVR